MSDLNLDRRLALLEALLFIHGEPISFRKIGEVLEMEEKEAAILVEELKKRLANGDRGLTIVEDEKRVQLVTKPEFYPLLERFVKSEFAEELTPASLETLAIIAYFGPISRARIEYQRGVNSSFILRNLMLRGLVERFPDPDSPNSYLYRPTFEFWRHLGVSRREDLPDYQKFRELLIRFENQPDS